MARRKSKGWDNWDEVLDNDISAVDAPTDNITPMVYNAGDSGRDVSDELYGLTKNADTGQVYSPTGANVTGVQLRDWETDTTDWLKAMENATNAVEWNQYKEAYELQSKAQGRDISDGTYTKVGGNYITSFKDSDGTIKQGYYGADENGNYGYFADAAHTQKIAGTFDVKPGTLGYLKQTDPAAYYKALGKTSGERPYVGEPVSWQNLATGESGTGAPPGYNPNGMTTAERLGGVYSNPQATGSKSNTQATSNGANGQLSVDDILKLFSAVTGGGASGGWNSNGTWSGTDANAQPVYTNQYADYINTLIKQLLGIQPFSYNDAKPEYEPRYDDNINALIEQLLGTQPFSYDVSQPEYQNQYADVIKTLLEQYVGRAPFSYDSAQPEYSSMYGDDIQALLEQVLNRGEFSYDPANDQLYQYYASMYDRNGRNAMENTLGQIAARTGGMASSYAGSAAQQTYNNYMEGLNDVIPQLYQLAYSMWRDSGSDQRSNLNTLIGLENQEYNKYINDLAQYNTDRSFAYGVDRDAVTDLLNQISAYQGLEQSDYNKFLNDLTQYNNDRNFAYGTYQDRILNMFKQLSALQNLDQTDYSKYLADLSQYNTDRSFAYGTYQDELLNKLKNLGVLQSLEQGDYAKYLNELGQWNTDRNFDYNAYRDAIGDQRYNQQWAYSVYRDLIGDQRYEDETAYNRYRDTVADERYKQQMDYSMSQDALSNYRYNDETTYNRLMQLASLGASMGDYSILKLLGIDTSSAENAANAYTPTFSVAQLQKEIDNARKYGTELSPTAQADYEYYYGVSYGGTSSTGSTPTGGGGGEGTGYDNGSLSKSQIKELQSILGVDEDGYWGPETQRAAKKLWGITDADAAWRMLNKQNTGGNESSNNDSNIHVLSPGVNGSPTAYKNTGGISQTDFDRAGRVIANYLAQGMEEKALGYIDNIWNSLSAEQQQTLNKNIKQYGLKYVK